MAIMTRTLGRAGADVTILGYGAMELRGGPRGPEIGDEDAGRLLNAVLDGGINLIDTGPLSQQSGVGQRNWASSGIEDLIKDVGPTNMEFMLRFTPSHPGLSSTIVGTANPAHLAANIATASRGPLPEDLYEEAKKRLQPADE